MLAKGDPVMSKKNKDIKMTIFIMVIGIGLIVAGVIGIVTSRIASKEYKSSTDIRKIPAVIVEFSTQDDKDDPGDVRYTTYKFKVSYVIDGKTYKGNYEERVWWNSYAKKNTYDKLRKDDTIDVEVYKTSKGDYKLSPVGNSVDLTDDFISECQVHSCRKEVLIRIPQRYQNSFKGFSYISSDF